MKEGVIKALEDHERGYAIIYKAYHLGLDHEDYNRLIKLTNEIFDDCIVDLLYGHIEPENDEEAERKNAAKIILETDTKELAISLKGASKKLKELIFQNVSARVKKMIEEEMDYMGPTRMGVVEESQQRIVEIVRRLEEEQQIVIVHGGPGGEIFV